jgi:hypothetical protein
VGAALSTLVALAALPTDAHADDRIHLRGSSRIDAHTARAAGHLLLSGVVVDDVGRPLPGARVAMTLTKAGDAVGGEPVRLASASPAACSDGATPPTTEGVDVVVLPGDEAGRFCVRLSLPTDRYLAHLEARPQGLVDGTKIDVPIDLSVAPLTLRFDPEPTTLSLDDATVNLEVVASTEDDGVTVAAAGLALSLTREGGEAVAGASTNASGRARFSVEARKLGPPGRGELHVTYPGGPDASAASRGVSVQRETWVDLSAPDAVDGRLPAGSPEDGISMRVVATARCAQLGCAGAPSGTVEARAGEAIVGVAPLVSAGGGGGANGAAEAHLVATFPMPLPSPSGEIEAQPLQFRYIPDAPWFRPRGELTLAQPVRTPSPMRKVPLALAGLAALAWLVLTRWPARAPAPTPARRSLPPRPAEAGVELLEVGDAARGWSGQLRDAHEGTAIVEARVAIERRGFERMETVAQVWSDAEGRFHLPPPTATVPGDEIVAEGSLHATLRRPLPAPGTLDIALVLRKRALLERLVGWARRKGMPFDARPEPTPGHVRRAAGAEFVVARWADAVERAAYGGQAVDAGAEAEIQRLAPAEPDPKAPDDPAHGDPHTDPRAGARLKDAAAHRRKPARAR